LFLRFIFCAIALHWALLAPCAGAERRNVSGRQVTELASQILRDQGMRRVHQMALDLLRGGVNAGTNYKAVWIRDLNTFIEVALEVNPPDRMRQAMLTFFKFQGADGDIVDLYFPVPAKPRSSDRTTPLAPGLVADKNTVEVDQESSLLQAVYKYVSVTHDRSILEVPIDGRSVRDRLGLALGYLLSERFDPQHGLIWGATRADWGDVQPESPHGTVLDSNSHRALSIYDNAMLLLAINDYVKLLGPGTREADHWKKTGAELRRNILKYLWDSKDQKFIPHVYLNGSPFPKDFDENAIYYHGGTAVAILAGLLTPEEVSRALEHMDADVKAAGASSIGLTLYPAYPDGFFQNPELRQPYTYQNGGDWTWFGGRMVEALIEQGDIADAYRELHPMIERVERVNGFYEWWTRDNQPRGSGDFRGSAGVLGHDIELLQAWVERQADRTAESSQQRAKNQKAG
jgi:Glycosyl hydrolase 36 superfamily, catalytic domain